MSKADGVAYRLATMTTAVTLPAETGVSKTGMVTTFLQPSLSTTVHAAGLGTVHADEYQEWNLVDSLH